MTILDIKNVNKKYDIEVLKNISCSFSRGEIVSIMGESGSGKSTLLNIMGGIDRSYGGDVYYDNAILKNKEENYIKNKVGIIFQNFNLIPYLNLIDNVLISKLFSVSKKRESKEKAKKILIDLGLEKQMYKYPSQVSGGEKQRVAIARALFKDPDIIFCDEPTGALDSKNTREILDIFTRIAKSGKTVIIATHSEEVSKSSHRVLKIRDGELLREETINDFIEYCTEQKDSSTSCRFNYIKGIILSIKGLKKKKIKTIMVSIGTSIGITGLILVLSISGGMKKYINEIINDSKNQNIIDVYKEKQENKQSNLVFENSDIEKINKLNYVESIQKGYANKEYYKMVIGNKEVIIENILTYSEQLVKKLILSGAFPKENEILINNSLYNKIDSKTNGIEYEGKVYSISGVYEDGFVENSIYFNYDDLKNHIGEKTNVLFIKTKQRDKLKISLEKEGYYFSYIEESLKTFNDTFNIVIFVLTIGSVISLIVSSVMIMVVLYIGVIERTREIGIFRSLGYKGKDIKILFRSEALIYGLVSSIISLIFSIPILKVVDSIMKDNYQIYMSSINLSYLIMSVILCFSLCLFASSYPAKKASKINIIDALRYE